MVCSVLTLDQEAGSPGSPEVSLSLFKLKRSRLFCSLSRFCCCFADVCFIRVVSVVHTELAIQISTFHFQITYDSFPCASIRFYALRFDSMRRFHHLFQDEKKSGNFKRSFQTNERLLRSIARSKASIALFQGQDRTFRAILALERAILALERAILKERERKAFFGGQERVPVRSVPEKNFRNAFLSVPQNQERVPERV